MLKTYLHLSVALFLVLISSDLMAQCNGRYVWEVFDDVDVTSDIYYGSGADFDGNNVDLYLDFYEPVGDTETERPIIILAHGGFFVFGDKTAEDMIALCTDYAQRGYVCASIGYRLGVGLTEVDSVGFSKAVIRAVQDAKGAVRYLRDNASTYGIDTSKMFLGGTSAGGVLAMHAGYLQSTDDLPAWINTEIAALGGLEGGNDGTPGGSSRIHGVVSYAGAIKSTSWMGSRNLPTISIHGDDDMVVPFGTGWVNYQLGLLLIPITTMMGSETIHQELEARGAIHEFWPYEGVGHVVHLDGGDGGYGLHPDRYPQTVHLTADFLHKQLDCYDPLASTQDASTPEFVAPVPNPAVDFVELSIASMEQLECTLVAADGRVVREWIETDPSAIRIDRAQLAEGLYVLRASNSYKSWISRIYFHQDVR